jgi:uncharacterized membrane protein YagU involved in acid resistance
MIDLAAALGWGAAATAALSVVMGASQGLGWSRMSLPYLIGTMFASDRRRAMQVGFLVHAVVGLVFALGYALAFDACGRAGPWVGAGLGLLHGVFVLVVGVELLAAIHPRMATRHEGPVARRRLEPPGFLGLNYGRSTPWVTLLAHVAYGAILGAWYPVA